MESLQHDWNDLVSGYLLTEMAGRFTSKKHQWKILFRCFRCLRRNLLEQGKMEIAMRFDRKITEFTGRIFMPNRPTVHQFQKTAYLPSRKFKLWMRGLWPDLRECSHHEFVMWVGSQEISRERSEIHNRPATKYFNQQGICIAIRFPDFYGQCAEYHIRKA